jgi:hypothetical protein
MPQIIVENLVKTFRVSDAPRDCGVRSAAWCTESIEPCGHSMACRLPSTFTAEQMFGHAVSADQKQLAIVRGRVTSDVVLVSEAR